MNEIDVRLRGRYNYDGIVISHKLVMRDFFFYQMLVLRNMLSIFNQM